jgi:hypothetical protein
LCLLAMCCLVPPSAASVRLAARRLLPCSRPRAVRLVMSQGIDIDASLVQQASVTLQSYSKPPRSSPPQPAATHSASALIAGPCSFSGEAAAASLPSPAVPAALVGSPPMSAAAGSLGSPLVFPANVSFAHADFVAPESEAGAAVWARRPIDVVLCMSVTKWVHLNGGDAAVHLLFQRVHALLPVGGIFILEPQPWRSYKKKRHLTPEISANFRSIQLKPVQFPDYLSSLGFDLVACLNTSEAASGSAACAEQQGDQGMDMEEEHDASHDSDDKNAPAASVHPAAQPTTADDGRFSRGFMTRPIYVFRKLEARQPSQSASLT